MTNAISIGTIIGSSLNFLPVLLVCVADLLLCLG